MSDELTKADLVAMLSLPEGEQSQALFDRAYKVKLEHVGSKVFFRGLIEFSNICEKNCYYCGIRRDNKDCKRYVMTDGEVLRAALWANECKYGSIVLQSGERTDANYISGVERLVKEIKKATGGVLGITLCLGEQSEGTYRRWFDAGAHRYLLRIETSSPALYRKLHPADHSFERRLECLKTLQRLGYQTGTGVMIGLPGQTVEDLAGDLLFFRDMDIDMIGMGPYIVHESTPLSSEFPDFSEAKETQLNLGLKMIAAARILLKDVNIAATTALQALRDDGRELGLKAGANVIMPNITDVKYRDSYQLYQGKPCLNDSRESCKGCLQRRIESIGETIAFNEWGDPAHFYERRRKSNATKD
jgi:biotin synthase